MSSSILYKISEEVYKKRARGEHIIEMNVGEVKMKPPKEIVEAVKERLKEGKVGYSPFKGEAPLIEKLAEKHDVDIDNVLITPGSKFALYALLKLLEGKSVGAAAPYWSAYELIAKEVRKEYIPTPTHFEDKWKVKEWRDADIYIVNSPSNPTGQIVNGPENGFIIWDKAYEDLIIGEKAKKKLALENSVHVYSFSKSLGLAGFRIGYVIGDKDLISMLGNFMKLTVTSVPGFLQLALADTYELWPSISEAIKKNFIENLTAAKELLSCPFIEPQAGFYIFPKVGNGADFAIKALNKGVAVVPGEAFGPYSEFVRISLAGSNDEVREGLAGLKELC